MTIKRVTVNNRRRCFEIETRKGVFAFPFVKLNLVPATTDRVKDVYVDRELGRQAITYVLESGEEDSVHLDDFLNYNKDPDYMRDMALYKLTVRARNLLKASKLPKRELARRMAHLTRSNISAPRPDQLQENHRSDGAPAGLPRLHSRFRNQEGRKVRCVTPKDSMCVVGWDWCRRGGLERPG